MPDDARFQDRDVLVPYGEVVDAVESCLNRDGEAREEDLMAALGTVAYNAAVKALRASLEVSPD